MESKEYFEKVMQDNNQNRKGRNGMDVPAKKKTNKPKVRVPRQRTDKSKPSSDTESNTPHRCRVYTATILEEMVSIPVISLKSQS